MSKSADLGRAAYSTALRRRLQDNSLEYFIPLTVRPAAAGGRSTASTSLIHLVTEGSETRIAILGNPGAGKTTLAKQLCLSYLDMPQGSLPVFIELKRYHPDRRDVETLFRSQLRDMHNQLGTEGDQPGLVVLDGLNEVPDGMIFDALAEVQELADSSELANVPVVLTCRTIDYPVTFWTPFSRYEVESPAESQSLEYLSDRLGTPRANELWKRLPARMRDLCQLPLLLGMLAFVLEGDPTVDENLLRNRTAVYTQFLSRLDSRTRERSRLQTPEDIRDSCYAFLAYSMQNQRVEIPLREMRRLVTEYFDPSWGIPIGTFQREILDLPPMGSIDGKRTESDSRSFMHQSFQEYFTALHIERALNTRSQARLKLADLAPFLKAEAIPWRETLTFLSGMLKDSTELVQACRVQSNIALAAVCIDHADYVDPAEVDDFICVVLEEFKYGEAFDYQLISYVQRAMARRSIRFPQRVVDDIDYWRIKYSRVTPQEIGESESDSEVIGMAVNGSGNDRLDAIWTLGRRRTQEAVPLLEQLAQSDPDNLIRENAVVALGRIAAPSSLAILMGIATSPSEERWNRDYAIHAIGSYASQDAVNILLDYLTAPDLQSFADDAAWALSALGESDPDLLRPALPQLLAALRSGADRYTKGCVLFAIGRGKFTEAGDAVARYLEHESDPFILEDGCHTLGVLGVESSIGLLSQMADPGHVQDPMTRRQALRSLLILGQAESAVVRAGRHDPVSYVRQVVEDYDRARG